MVEPETVEIVISDDGDCARIPVNRRAAMRRRRMKPRRASGGSSVSVFIAVLWSAGAKSPLATDLRITVLWFKSHGHAAALGDQRRGNNLRTTFDGGAGLIDFMRPWQRRVVAPYGYKAQLRRDAIS